MTEADLLREARDTLHKGIHQSEREEDCARCQLAARIDAHLAEPQPDLVKFARLMFQESDWPDGGDIEGGAFQDAAIACGLLVLRKMYAPCVDLETGYCQCNYEEAPTEEEWAAGRDCYFKAAFLLEGE